MFTVLLCTKLLGQVIVYRIDGHQYVHSTVIYHIVGQLIVYQINGNQYVLSTIVYQIIRPCYCVPN